MTAPARPRCATLGCGRPAVPGDAYCGECQTAPGPVERCERTDLLRDQCAHCRPTDPDNGLPMGAAGGEVVNRFVASYDGRCADCGGRIEAGSEIGKLADGGYVCEECLG